MHHFHPKGRIGPVKIYNIGPHMAERLKLDKMVTFRRQKWRNNFTSWVWSWMFSGKTDVKKRILRTSFAKLTYNPLHLRPPYAKLFNSSEASF